MGHYNITALSASKSQHHGGRKKGGGTNLAKRDSRNTTTWVSCDFGEKNYACGEI